LQDQDRHVAIHLFKSFLACSNSEIVGLVLRRSLKCRSHSSGSNFQVKFCYWLGENVVVAEVEDADSYDSKTLFRIFISSNVEVIREDQRGALTAVVSTAWFGRYFIKARAVAIAENNDKLNTLTDHFLNV